MLAGASRVYGPTSKKDREDFLGRIGGDQGPLGGWHVVLLGISMRLDSPKNAVKGTG